MSSQEAPVLAAPAAEIAPTDDEPNDGELDPLVEICEDWACWVRTRRFYKPPSMPPSILGRLTSRTRAFSGGPNASNNAMLSAFNEAVESEPMEALDRQVFELHYRHRVKPIKIWADALGISRRHWYNLLRAFEQRVQAVSLQIYERNMLERGKLRSFSE